MFIVYKIGHCRTHLDMTTTNEQTAKLRVLELEHAGIMAYYEQSN